MAIVSQGLLRTGGLILLLAGLANFITHTLHLQEDTPLSLEQLPHFLDMAVGTHIALFLATPLMLIGLTTLFIRHAGAIAWWGWIGYVCLFFAFVIESVHSVLQVYQYPVLFDGITSEEQLAAASDIANRTLMAEGFPSLLQMAGGIMVLLGIVVTTISFYRAGVFSKWLALGFLIMPSTLFFPWEYYGRFVFPVSFLVYAVYGLLMLTDRRETKNFTLSA
ncbi:hypothetical protein [Paenibacillus daejeonensis]|uniref:hypothetical protein n=1 Tax=Paenibacillus daejeonensis TaxID=135193 RepID=UPI00035FCFDD|nr:hypothetical protein [Paenibacillus daejeonensis]